MSTVPSTVVAVGEGRRYPLPFPKGEPLWVVSTLVYTKYYKTTFYAPPTDKTETVSPADYQEEE